MDEQLKHLFDYTKFHIGMYTTLVAGIIGVFSNDLLKKPYVEFLPFITASVVLFLFAGMFGGLVASSIPYHKTFDEFMSSNLGPWGGGKFRINARTCTHLEHTCFWFGSLISVVGMVVVLWL